MRVENTRRSQTVRLQHAAALHRSRTELLDQLVDAAGAGLRAGFPVALALRPETARAVSAELGEPDGLVPLSQVDGPDGESGQTVAARRARELRSLTHATGRPVTVLNEHTSLLDGADGTFWTELDAAFNIALAELAVSLTCFFPELPVHRDILYGVRRNHPLLVVGGELRHNPHHRGPRDVLAARPAPAPAVLGPPDLRLPFGAWQLHEVRSAVEDALLSTSCSRERAEDVVLAVNEVATNAVEHGGGEAELLIWFDADGVVCEVHDRGRLHDPLPGLSAPHSSNPRGRGVWIARQLCDSLHVWTDSTGTHVRVRAEP